MPAFGCRSRLFELMTEALERALRPEEQRELDALLRAHPDVSAEDFELAAAAAFVAFEAQAPQSLPSELGRKLNSAAKQRPHLRLVSKD